ncbi:MAG: hypothetical protein AB7O38_29910, partial [Pirellulaceae bacterium]
MTRWLLIMLLLTGCVQPRVVPRLSLRPVSVQPEPASVKRVDLEAMEKRLGAAMKEAVHAEVHA